MSSVLFLTSFLSFSWNTFSAVSYSLLVSGRSETSITASRNTCYLAGISPGCALESVVPLERVYPYRVISILFIDE